MIKMDGNTVYKTSFQHMEPCLFKISRPPPILPVNQLKTNPDIISKDTITKVVIPALLNCSLF